MEKAKRMANAREKEELQRLSVDGVMPIPEDAETRAQLGACGVVFEEAVPGLASFAYVTFNKGWELRSTGEGQNQVLLDDQGRTRVVIELDTHVRYEQRYLISYWPFASLKAKGIACKVHDWNQEEIFVTRIHTFKGASTGRDAENKRKLALAEAEAWLDEHRPNWRNSAKSWEDAEPRTRLVINDEDFVK